MGVPAMVDYSKGWFAPFNNMKFFLTALLLIMLQHSCAVSPIDCNAAESVGEKVLDLINKRLQDGYLFQLLRIADAHLDKVDSTVVYYLALDVKESDCSVLSRKHWSDCKPAATRRPSDLVIGQCKVIATTQCNESLSLRVNDFNCTTSSVSSALVNTIDSPVLLDFFEDTEPYRKQAIIALEKYKTENSDFTSFRVDQVERASRGRGGERTNYYVDFSVRNCSRHYSHRHPNVFGFCQADLSYDVGASDLETPEDLVVNCNIFNPEEQRNFSDGQHHPGHLLHSGRLEHPPRGRHSFELDKSRDRHHPYDPYALGCPPSLEDKDDPESGASPPPRLGSRCHWCHHRAWGHDQIQRPFHNHGKHHGRHSREHPHGHHPQEHHSHKHHSHKKHSHDGDGPCDPPSHNQGLQDHRHHELPQKHSEERQPSRRHLSFQWRKIGYVYRLPPLSKGDILPLPEANFPRCSYQNNPLKPEIQLFPQSTSASCPGKFKNEFLQLLTFFKNIVPK